MGLQDFWFIALAALFLGFFVLEGFDFGVGMLMAFFGARAAPSGRRTAPARRAQHHRPGLGRQRGLADHRGRRDVRGVPRDVRDAVLRPVPAAAGDPGRHDRAHLRHRVARQDRRPAVAAAGPTSRIAIGSWVPAVLWGVAFAALVRGLPVDADEQIAADASPTCSTRYTLLGGLATGGLFAFHGAVFIALKTEGVVRDDAVRFASRLALPGDRRGRRPSDCGPNWRTARTGPGWCSASPWSRSCPPSCWCGAAAVTVGLRVHRSRGRGGGGPAVRLAVPEPGAVDARTRPGA